MALSNHDFERILICASEACISDIHFHVGEPVFWRRYGVLSPLREYIPTTEDLWRIFTKIATDEQREKYVDGNDVDFSWNLEQWRYRITAYKQKEKLSLCFRTINRLIPLIEDLGNVSEFGRFLDVKNGLLVVAGESASGKSTTIASFLNELNKRNDYHIVTLENPVEWLLPKGRSFVSQRTLGEDFFSYSSAITSAIKHDADVIYCSSVSSNTIIPLLEAAEAGKLVIVSVTAKSTDMALMKLATLVPPEANRYYDMLMANNLVGVMAQKLLPCKKGGLVSAVEIINGDYELVMSMAGCLSELERKGLIGDSHTYEEE